MLNKIIELEKELQIKGYHWDTDEDLRTYFCKPTENIKYFLNKFTNNHYDNTGWHILDSLTISITNDYGIMVSTWIGDNEINDAVEIRNCNLDFFKLLFRNIEGVDEYEYF